MRTSDRRDGTPGDPNRARLRKDPWNVLLFDADLAAFIAPDDNAVVSSVPPRRRGIASGPLGTFSFTVQSTGFARAGTVFVGLARAARSVLRGRTEPASDDSGSTSREEAGREAA